MISIDTIERDLIIANGEELPDDFVAVAVQLNPQGTAYHAGLVIGMQGVFKLFHYTGSEVLLDDEFGLDEPIYCKILDFIDDFEVINFLALCEILMQDAKPKYGLVFDGSFFNNGIYYTDSGLPFITTCVGFCLMTIKSFLLKTNFLALDDWDENSAEDFRIAYLENYIDVYQLTLNRIEKEKPEIKGDLAQKYVKRITPSEYASAGFYNNLPVSKENVNAILPQVIDVLKAKIAS